MPSFAKHSPCFALPRVSTANQFLSRSKNMVSRIKIVCCALRIRSALEYISTAIKTSSFAKQKHSSAKYSPSFAPQYFYRETISSALASALLSLMAFHRRLTALWIEALVCAWLQPEWRIQCESGYSLRLLLETPKSSVQCVPGKPYLRTTWSSSRSRRCNC